MREKPEAQRLREAGQLWPENLTDAELTRELDSARADTQPIGAQMLRAEAARRLAAQKLGAM